MIEAETEWRTVVHTIHEFERFRVRNMEREWETRVKEL